MHCKETASESTFKKYIGEKKKKEDVTPMFHLVVMYFPRQ